MAILPTHNIEMTVDAQANEVMQEHIRRAQAMEEEDMAERRMRDRYERMRGRHPRDREEEFMLRAGEAMDDLNRQMSRRMEDIQQILIKLVKENEKLSDKVNELEETVKELSFYDEEPALQAA